MAKNYRTTALTCIRTWGIVALAGILLGCTLSIGHSAGQGAIPGSPPTNNSPAQFTQVFTNVLISGSWLLSQDEGQRIQLELFAKTLEPKSNAIVEWVGEQLKPQTRLSLQEFQLEAKKAHEERVKLNVPFELQRSVLLELNKILMGKNFSEKITLSGPTIGSDTRLLMDNPRLNFPPERLNRLLLEDSFPTSIPRKERVLSMPGCAYFVDLNYIDQTVQLFDESGQKAFFLDLAAINKKNHAVRLGLGIGMYEFTPTHFIVMADKNRYSINVKYGTHLADSF